MIYYYEAVKLTIVEEPMKLQFYFLFFVIVTFGKLSFSQNDNFTKLEEELSQYSPKNTELITPKAIDELLVIEDVSPELSLEGRKPLLLIHGWSFDGDPASPSGGYWDHFKNYLMNDSTLRANFKPYYVKYWSNEVSVKEIGEALRIKVEEAGLNEQKIVIVAHSMGGLVARSYMTEQLFSQGAATGLQCGKLVDRLITLGTPHHGSPMANGPARNAKLSFLLSLYINTLESAVFKDVKYNEVNRSDLWWDNYDGLLNYTAYPNEKNNWLTNLNQDITFDAKTICYTGSVTGKFVIPESGNTTQEYQLGAWFTEQGFGFQNDGIVPVQSAGFGEHTVKKIRHFDEYNHADIIRGKDDKTELFDPLKEDLSDVFPLKLTWPNTATALYLKHAKYFDITWEAPSTASKLNIYLSVDNGNTYQLIESNVDAQSGKYSWQIPDMNANECLVKITNADFENEQAWSQQSFTIYNNQLTITTPAATGYVVRSRPDTIKWEQVGLGNKVQISYSDPKNSIEKIIAQETSTSVGVNTFVWAADESLLPTDQATIQIQLLGLNETYGDDETYIFNSESFQVFGDPTVTILSPETNPIDFFDVKGEQLVIGESNTIHWKAAGEINFIQFFLCDQDKQIIAPIETEDNTPALEVDGTTQWTIPEFYGDAFYFMARAGYAIDSITVESYSENSFRINKQTKINSPSDQEADISLLPCFELTDIENATKYEFILEGNQQTGQQLKWNYESQNNTFCIPTTIENELVPGNSYQLTARVWLDMVPSFADQVTFTTEAAKPWAFTILEPIEGDSVEGDEVSIIWQRAVGTSSYSIQLLQSGEPITNMETLGALDTIVTKNIHNVAYYEPIEINVTATNMFGSVNASANFVKKFKTGVNMVPAANNQFALANFPNPFNDETTFEFYLSERVANLQINLFDLTGKKIGTILQGDFNKGKHQLKWNRETLSGTIPEKGVYVYQLKANGLVESKFLMIR